MALQKHGAGTIIVGARTSGNTTVVLSTKNSGLQSSSGEVYVDFVTRNGINWNVPLSFSADGIASVPQGAALCYATAEMFEQQNASTFGYGYVRLPDVQSMEVDFTSGQVLTDQSGDGMFAVVRPGSDPGTKLRAIDAKGAVIHTVAMPTPRASSLPPRGNRASGGGSMSSFECSP
jgi:hypothetical protein